MIFCTAGHVDHGKTALVRALTGVDTDRLAEERRRGLTIELGFAPLELPGVGRVSLVDVPGHAQFIPTMLSGCGGLDGALFTVAADEGPMPQTAEHLDILSLLGLERGVVALTRADLASPAARAEAEARTRALTAGTFLEGAPRIFVSAVTGEGLEALRAALAAMARQAPPPPEGSPRLQARLAARTSPCSRPKVRTGRSSPSRVCMVLASSALATMTPLSGTRSAKARKECSTSSRSLKKSRWSASMLRITATVGKKERKELQYSQLSRMMVSPWPTR